MSIEQEYQGPERRAYNVHVSAHQMQKIVRLVKQELADDFAKQLEAVAEKAAEKVMENFQLEVGKFTLRAAGYVVGTVFAGLALYFGVAQEALKKAVAAWLGR